jgi:hypothetical protein
VEHAYYSVPYALISKTVDVRLSARTLEIFHRQTLVATHARVQRRGQFVTHEAHRPVRHHAVIELTEERLMQRALAIGPATAAVLAEQVQRRAHPEEALRSCLGILRLAQDFTPLQLEAAAVRAVELQSYSYRTLRTLIRTPHVPDPTPAPQKDHENLRGADYFH